MTPDELVTELFRRQTAAAPDEDPGDLTISVQDDATAVMVVQKGQIIGLGPSIEAALTSALDGDISAPPILAGSGHFAVEVLLRAIDELWSGLGQAQKERLMARLDPQTVDLCRKAHEVISRSRP
jgi:hypothetical protein